jgi:hypothetical protein
VVNLNRPTIVNTNGIFNQGLDYEPPEALYKSGARVIYILTLINKKKKEAKKNNFILSSFMKKQLNFD